MWKKRKPICVWFDRVHACPLPHLAGSHHPETQLPEQSRSVLRTSEMLSLHELSRGREVAGNLMVGQDDCSGDSPDRSLNRFVSTVT
jgi:hypothetical protein